MTTKPTPSGQSKPPAPALDGEMKAAITRVNRLIQAGEPQAPTQPPAREHVFGKDCPKGMVQIEFVGCAPGDHQGDYGWIPTKSAFLEIYVDGQRFRIQVGDYAAPTKSGRRRGLNICGPMDVRIDRHSVNAIDIYLEKEEGTAPAPAAHDLNGFPFGQIMAAIQKARWDGNWDEVSRIGEAWRLSKIAAPVSPGEPPAARPAPANADHWAVKRPGLADQFRGEAVAARVALGLGDEKSDDISPSDISTAIAKLRAGDRPLVPALDLEAAFEEWWGGKAQFHSSKVVGSDKKYCWWAWRECFKAIGAPPASPPSGTGRECWVGYYDGDPEFPKVVYGSCPPRTDKWHWVRMVEAPNPKKEGV